MTNTNQVVSFLGKTYAQSVVPGLPAGTIPLDGLTNPDLARLYNLISSNLGRGRVKRFSDARAGVRRTWALLLDYEKETGEEEPVVEEGKTQSAPADPAPEKEAPAPKKAPKKQGERRKSDRWRKPKHTDPAKVCWKPRAGTKQDKAYQLLTQPGGIDVDEFCRRMSALDKSGKNTTEWCDPRYLWGALSYLFVTQKGYGLDFDGRIIRLLIAKEERSSGDRD